MEKVKIGLYILETICLAMIMSIALHPGVRTFKDSWLSVAIFICMCLSICIRRLLWNY